MDEESVELVRRILQSAKGSFERLAKQCENARTRIDNGIEKLKDIQEGKQEYYLKPCPFCGNIPEGVRTNFILYWIECKCCRYEFQDWISQQSCIDRWNTRYTQPTLTPYVEPEDEEEDEEDE